MGLSHSPQIVTDGLIAYLDAGNKRSYPGSGTVWTDLMNSSNTFTYTGTINYSTASGGQFNIDNAGEQFTGPDIPYRINSPNFSYEAVFYFNNISQTSVFINKREPTSPYAQIGFGIQSDPKWGGDGTNLFFFQKPEFSSVERYTSYNLAPFGSRYHHAIITANASSTKIYLNSVLVATSLGDYTGNTFNIFGYPVIVGYSNVNNGISMNIARIYNRPLTQDEITQNFNATRGRFGI
jgi:Concanavalin A-like lectin/glucanases superfamily